MRNFCQILSKKTKSIPAFILVLYFISGLTPAAEAISAKLRGKIALGVVLSGGAYTTHALIKRDRQAAEELRHHLGSPERVVQFERGFDLWRIEYYEEQCYLFQNNRFIKTVPCINLQSDLSNRRWAFAPLPVTLQAGFRYTSIFPSSRGPGNKSETFAKRSGAKRESPIFKKPFLIDMPVSGYPRWSRLYRLDSLRDLRLVSSDLGRLAIERSLDPRPWLSH